MRFLFFFLAILLYIFRESTSAMIYICATAVVCVVRYAGDFIDKRLQ
jgi:hypothetical protein